ncbi:MAG TPA: DUF4911 domain-containing protein [Candidatus Limnocylindria bacterium]|nr:DUF4911 domain-containing protein [Candidatus Limnocylindria bacterium]
MDDVVPIFLLVPRAEIGYVKFIFESYEGIAVLRTIDRQQGLLVVLAVPDGLAQARRVVAALAEEIGCREVPRPPDVDDLLGADLGEITSADEERA